MVHTSFFLSVWIVALIRVGAILFTVINKSLNTTNFHIKKGEIHEMDLCLFIRGEMRKKVIKQKCRAKNSRETLFCYSDNEF